MKRQDYISRDEYFMWVSLLSAQRSKDPSTQVWACIVNKSNRIVWIWYNWFPSWCSDEEFPRWKEWGFLDTKYAYVVHAEANAILNSHWINLEWCTIYVALFPCNECTKLIIQSGIKKVVYLSNKDSHKDFHKASRKMLESAWVETVQLIPTKETITINYNVKK
jgi:dCMP deaminase